LLLCLLCVSVIYDCLAEITTETQRTQRVHREEMAQLLCLLWLIRFSLGLP